jgi:hypothetical protein
VLQEYGGHHRVVGCRRGLSVGVVCAPLPELNIAAKASTANAISKPFLCSIDHLLLLDAFLAVSVSIIRPCTMRVKGNRLWDRSLRRM